MRIKLRPSPSRLQLGGLSFTFGHTQIGPAPRLLCSAIVVFMIVCTLHYASIVLRRFALNPESQVSGAFFIDQGRWQSRPFRDGGLSRRKSRCAATAVGEAELLPLTGRAGLLDGEVSDEAHMSAASPTASPARPQAALRRPGAAGPHTGQPSAHAPPINALSWVKMALDGRAYESDGTRVRGSSSASGLRMLFR